MSDTPSIERILWLVWRAWSRETADAWGAALDFDAFLTELVDYELPEATDVDPTKPTLSA